MEKEKPNPRELHKVFFFETLASYKRKSSCCISCTPLGSVTKQNLLHQHWRSYWCFYMKLLQINYNNQRDAVKLVTYWDSCIERRDCHYIASPIGYCAKSSTIGWHEVVGFLLLVTSCFDNSEFLGVVTLNSPGGVLSRWFSLFINKPLVSNLISTAFSYLMICFYYHAYCM